jgi:hypothetical protein
MVVDPFSIAGAVGLAAGLTGFVASTIEKAVGQVNTATHANQRLDGHQLALQAVMVGHDFRTSEIDGTGNIASKAQKKATWSRDVLLRPHQRTCPEISRNA